MQQPNVSFVWGNHDMAWLGACLGHEALICQVLRISLRYRRLLQLEEGYGINLQPLEHLVRAVYANDPATSFQVKGADEREYHDGPDAKSRHRQFKLDGRLRATPNGKWTIADCCTGLISKRERSVDGIDYPLNDVYFPTIDPSNPYELTAEERLCVPASSSFLASQKLWNQMMVSHGTMYLRREEHLIFHGCSGGRQGGFCRCSSKADPTPGSHSNHRESHLQGHRREGTRRSRFTLVPLSGPESPLFGKDRIATLERDLIPDNGSSRSQKSLYFV